MKKKLVSMLCVIITLMIVLSSLSVCAGAMDSMYPDAAPSLRVSEVNFTSVKLEWSERYDSTYQYLVYRSPSGKKGTWTKLTTTKAGVYSYVDKSVVPNQKYYYTVKSYKYIPEYKMKLVSRMSTVWQVSTQIPRPVFTLVGNGGKGVVLKWDIDKEMNGVVIYRSMTGKAGSWTKIKTINNNKTKTYTDSKVNIGETYYYCFKVYKTVNGKNYYSQASKSYKSTILDVSVPQNLKAVPRDDGIMLTYSKSLGTIGYMIYRSETGKKGTWTKLTTTKSNNTLSYLDNTAVSGKTYYYTIKSYKTVNGETYYSNPAPSVMVVNDVAPPELSFVTGDSVTFTNHYEEIPVTLSFKNINNEDALKIYIDEFEISDVDKYSEAELEKFFSECKFLYDVDEEKSTENELALIIYRVAPGMGTLKFEYNDASAELKVNCAEFDFDTDLEKINDNYEKALVLAYDAAVLLADGIDSQKYATIVENGTQARAKLDDALVCLDEVKKLLDAHKEEFGTYSRYIAEVNLIDDAIETFKNARERLADVSEDPEPIYKCEKALNYIVGYFENLDD